MVFLLFNPPATGDERVTFPATQAAFSVTNLNNITISHITHATGEKPQSKVWFHDQKWWAVLPDSAGTHIWRLDGVSWSSILQISPDPDTRADCKADGDVVHILLVRDGISTLQLVSVEYLPASRSYRPWSERPAGAVNIHLEQAVGTATIDIDSRGKMWLAYDASTTINVRYSPSPYSDWSNLPVILDAGVRARDICVVTAFANKIGVLWSDQITRQFGFRYHEDGANPDSWSDEENPPNPFGDAGGGFADDHLNLATASDGSIYAAVKTGFNTPGFPVIVLLVRRPSGEWSSYRVDDDGTRPIVLLDEAEEALSVVYTRKDRLNPIVYKQSPAYGIAFGSQMALFSDFYNNVTSTKQNYIGEVVFFACDENSTAASVIATAPPLPSFANDGSGRALEFDGSDDHLSGNNLALNITGQITLEAWISPASASNRYILRKGRPGATSGYEIGLNSSSKVYARLYQAGSGTAYTVTSVTNYPTNGNWMHAAVSYDGSAIRLYVNGVQEATLNAAIAIGTNGDPLAIGAQPEGTGAFFVGRLDEVRIWNLARSQQQIREGMCRKLSGGESGLAGYWPLDEESGMAAYDRSGNNIDLVLMNMAENDHVWSGAPLGDESAFDYDAGNGGFIASLSHSDGDNLSAAAAAGDARGIQIYRADANPLRPGATLPPELAAIDSLRFWGVFVAGSGNPQYTVTYAYRGHPGVITGSNLRLAVRDNHAADTWADLDATPDNGANTLGKTGQAGAEYALAFTTRQQEPISEFRLYPNYPNPFNPGTTIKFEVPESGAGRQKIALTVYNSLGQEVKKLYDGVIEGGAHEIYWDARDGRGNPAASGQYFVRLRGNDYVKTIAITRIR
ncbi:MAG: T9SS type A sorting domain-containing protein [Calditrichia bacterium]|nr:T9SS type A sorting domain-containing protein [Calditrichia bacterium]